jgi:hypothetical protein
VRSLPAPIAGLIRSLHRSPRLVRKRAYEHSARGKSILWLNARCPN